MTDMVRTLGGCIAVAICSAISREHIHSRLSSFLSGPQIDAVLKSSSFVAQLPEDTRNRIGRNFGDSYNKQFQVMLAFTGLNILVTIALIFVRKRMGIFGTMPGRTEDNEFTQAAGEKANDLEGNKKKAGTTTIATDQPTVVDGEMKDVSVARPKDDNV